MNTKYVRLVMKNLLLLNIKLQKFIVQIDVVKAGQKLMVKRKEDLK